MNFLAHIFLSGDQPKRMVGNFIGDFVKGKNALKDFDSEILEGIELHRTIDAFTDSHPIVSQSKNRLRPKYRHYSGVIVDVFYDHYLAAEWSSFHSSPLETFADASYRILENHHEILPEGVRRMLPYMVRGNWLLNYAKVEGVDRALTGMARRTPYVSKMDEARNDLITHYDEFKNEFLEFFPHLVQHCKTWITKRDQERT